MDNFLIFKKPMVETVVNAGDYRRIVEGYKYISLLTDGGINPRNNITESAVCVDNDTDFYVEFDNGERIWINAELKNVLIPPRVHYFDLFNKVKSAGLCAAKDTEAGFNNLFIVLSREKIKMNFFKRSPCVSETITIGAMAVANLFFGHNKTNPSYTIKIPWIPEEYRQGRLIAGTDDPANVSGIWYSFAEEYGVCYNTFALSPTAYITPLQAGLDFYGINRHLWELTNIDIVADHYVRYSISWHKS